MIEPQTFSSSFIGNRTGSVRAMYYNVFGYSKCLDAENSDVRTLPKSERQAMQAELMRLYGADIVCLQEFSKDFRINTKPLLSESYGYTEVEEYHTKTQSDGTPINYTPIFYRSDVLRLEDSGYYLYPETMVDPADPENILEINDVKSKSLTWAVFYEIATGKRFIVINTHFMYSAKYLTSELQREVRVQNAENLLRVLSEIKSVDGYSSLPVVMGGDLNGYVDEPFFTTLTEGGMEWLYRVSPVKDDSCGYCGYCYRDYSTGEIINCFSPVREPEKTLDYIFMMRGGEENTAVVSAYVTITDEVALQISDHCPRFADLTFN